MVDAQAAEDYATYIVTLGGNDLHETDPNPLVTLLLSHAQDLRIKAKEKVQNNDYYGLVLTPQLQFTVVCFLLSASYHLIIINQSIFFFKRKHMPQELKKI